MASLVLVRAEQERRHAIEVKVEAVRSIRAATKVAFRVLQTEKSEANKKYYQANKDVWKRGALLRGTMLTGGTACVPRAL